METARKTESVNDGMFFHTPTDEAPSDRRASNQSLYEEEALPQEPPLIWEQTGAGTAPDYHPDKTLAELLHFHHYGGPVTATPSDRRRMPALLYPYRDISRIRTDYPVCLIKDDPATAARTVTEIIDTLIGEAAPEGDAGRRFTRYLYQLESVLRSLAEEESGVSLSDLWDRAADRLLASSPLSDEKKETLRHDLAVARAALRMDGEVISCNMEAPERLCSAVLNLYWRQRRQEWDEDLKSLIYQLQEVLRADFNRSPAARDPDHLRASVGTDRDDLDFDRMARILSESELGDPMPASRRARLDNVLATMLRLKPLFGGSAEQDEKTNALPFHVDTVFKECAAADHLRTRMRIMADFFKAVRIARLEIENRYCEAVHDPFFDCFDVIHMTDEEVALCPPVLVSLNQGAPSDTGELLDILNTDLPIKILIRLDNLFYAGDTARATTVIPDWPARLASMTMAMNHVYVLQTPASHFSLMQSGFLDGIGYRGPALFVVYTGNRDHLPGWPIYLNAAGAMESRVFPAFTFNPGKGDTLVERFEIRENPQYGRDWTLETTRYRNHENQETSTEMAFTPADFMFCDVRFAAHFWCVPPEKWHQNMMPLPDFLQTDRDAAAIVPYLTVIDEDGQIGRVVMSRMALNAVLLCRSFWRNLQEYGGVNNSFALNMLAGERQRFEKEKQQAVEALQEQYHTRLDQDIGTLTQEIVQRIATRLMVEDATGSMPRTSLPAEPVVGPATTVSPSAPADDEIPEKVEEAEEGAGGFDDPYIDTALCTSCNDCITLNNQLFGYNENKQAHIKDPAAGTYRDLVVAAEKCPVHIIHPGKPKNPDEAGLDELMNRAAPFL